MSAPIRIHLAFDHNDRAYLPGETVAIALELKATRTFTASISAGRYATVGDDPAGERLHPVDAELAHKAAFAAGQTETYPLSFTAPDLPAHELRKLHWWAFVALDMGMSSEGDLEEVRGFSVQHAEDRIIQARQQGRLPAEKLKWKVLQQNAGAIAIRSFLSISTLGGGLAALGPLFSPYWAQHAHVAGVRWFVALVVLGGLAIGRKVWESEDAAKHGRDAAAGFFVPFYVLVAALSLYVWTLEPGFNLKSMQVHTTGIQGIHQFYLALQSPSGYLLVPLFLGVLLFSLAGFSAAPRQVGVPAVFALAGTVLAGLVGAAGLSAFVASTSDWGALVACGVGIGLFLYLCRRPDWANKGLKFSLLGLAPLVLLAMLQSLAVLFSPAQVGGLLPGLTGLMVMLVVLGTMGYLGNRNLLAAMQVGSIRAELVRDTVAPGQFVEVAIRIVPRRETVVAFSALEAVCWRSQRRSGDNDTQTWREWQGEAKGESVSLVPGQVYERVLRLALPIDARISEVGSNATWWEAYVYLSFEGKADWSTTYALTVKRG